MSAVRRFTLVAVVAVAITIPARGGADAPVGRYCISPPDAGTAATVLDTGTGLTWLQAPEPGSFTWQQAIDRCASLTTNGAAWRLPSMKELMTLGDPADDGVSVDAAVFPDLAQEPFWSETPFKPEANRAWIVNGQNSGGADVVDFKRVRCVMRTP